MTADTTSTVGSSAQGKKQCQFGWRWLATLGAPHLNESLLEVGIPVLRGLAGCVLELQTFSPLFMLLFGHPTASPTAAPVISANGRLDVPRHSIATGVTNKQTNKREAEVRDVGRQLLVAQQLSR